MEFPLTVPIDGEIETEVARFTDHDSVVAPPGWTAAGDAAKLEILGSAFDWAGLTWTLSWARALESTTLTATTR
jgi:hypothetical protein